MHNYKKDYKNLDKTYIASLTYLNKHMLREPVNFMWPLTYFIRYLRYMRDKIIVSGEIFVDGYYNAKLATLTLAIDAYESYHNSIVEYMKVSKNLKDPKRNTKLAKLKANKKKYWNTLWKYISDYMEGWTNIDEYSME